MAANLCDLVAQPAQFMRKLVSIRAEVVVGFETQGLIDASCPQQRIWFEVDEPQRDSHYRALERAWKNSMRRAAVSAIRVSPA